MNDNMSLIYLITTLTAIVFLVTLAWKDRNAVTKNEFVLWFAASLIPIANVIVVALLAYPVFEAAIANYSSSRFAEWMRTPLSKEKDNIDD